MLMLTKLIPNFFLYLSNYVKYRFLYPNSYVSPRSFLKKVTLGKHVSISGGVYLNNCQIDDYTYISGNDGGGIVSGFHNISIGKFCSIGNHIEIISESSHDYKYISQYPFYSMANSPCYGMNNQKITIKPVTIGNDVWIGSNVTILGGVIISDGAVIGAGSVVTKNIPAYSIVVGNPAKSIKKRFNDNQINKLCSIEWWNWPVKKIIKEIKTITNPNINLFIKKNRK